MGTYCRPFAADDFLDEHCRLRILDREFRQQRTEHFGSQLPLRSRPLDGHLIAVDSRTAAAALVDAQQALQRADHGPGLRMIQTVSKQTTQHTHEQQAPHTRRQATSPVLPLSLS